MNVCRYLQCSNLTHIFLMLSKSDTRGSAMSGIAGFMSCSFMKLIYQKFSCISVLSQAELGMQLKTQLNWDQNCIFTEWNELDVRSAMFGMAEFWVSDFESISLLRLLCSQWKLHQFWSFPWFDLGVKMKVFVMQSKWMWAISILCIQSFDFLSKL